MISTHALAFHGFLDVSIQTCAAVVYVYIQNQESRAHVSFITAHTKLAPLKVTQRIILPQGDTTISSLELRGAPLLAAMVDD